MVVVHEFLCAQSTNYLTSHTGETQACSKALDLHIANRVEEQSGIHTAFTQRYQTSPAVWKYATDIAPKSEQAKTTGEASHPQSKA